MQKKNIMPVVIAAVVALSIAAVLSGCEGQNKPSSQPENSSQSQPANQPAQPEKKPVTDGKIHHVASYGEELGENTIWCAPMELCWNEAMEINGGPLGNADNATKQSLNEKPFDKTYLADDHYYNYAKVVEDPQKTTDEINAALKEKFGQTSDLLTGSEGNPGALFFYSMLYRKFAYATPFAMLDKAPFAVSLEGAAEKDIAYFGVNEDMGTPEMAEQITVLYYSGDERHAVMIDTVEGDRVIFVKGPEAGSAKEIFETAMAQASGYDGSRNLGRDEMFKAPVVSIDVEDDFATLKGASLVYEGGKQVVDEAKQKTKLMLDNEGGEVKSEAYMSLKATSMPTHEIRNFVYDDAYAIFIIDGSATANATALENGNYTALKPYLVARVNSAALFQQG